MQGIALPSQIIVIYLLLHLRIVGLIFSAPVFSSGMAPAPFKYLFAVLITASAIGLAGNQDVALLYFDNVFTLGLMAAREFLIGVALGFFSSLPLVALRVAGEQAGMLVGMSMSQVMDPMTQTENSIIGQLEFFLGLWFYFRWNGHLLLIQAVLESLKLLPLGRLSPFPAGALEIGLWLQSLFILAMRITLPFYCALILADVGLGFLARTVPQMNVFILGMPVKVALGFFVLAAVLPLTIDVIYTQLEHWIEFAMERILFWRTAL